MMCGTRTGIEAGNCTPHDVAIAHTDGCLTSRHETKNSAENEDRGHIAANWPYCRIWAFETISPLSSPKIRALTLDDLSQP